ncbi:MAG: hypothetical protein QOJ65_2355 [Fimbriimonadaceae bacterium]|nr:hypothetical protein [Fimbriimonadaceae bacterium]
MYFPNPPSPNVVEDLRRAVSAGVEVSQEKLHDYEVLIEGRPDASLLHPPSLKLLIVPFAGVPAATLELLRDRPQIEGHNLHHNAGDTAEVALALLFSAAKRVVPLDQRLRQNDWSPRYQPSESVSLGGKTALILGYGEIGQRIACSLRSLGMQVLATRRRPGAEQNVFPAQKLLELLPRANVLIIALPQTSETEGLIGDRELRLLPPNAILVNIARAAIVDEEALFNALNDGHLHSAGLDVWYQYPQGQPNSVPGYFTMPASATDTPPSRFPFAELANVVMSPHRGGVSMDTESRRVAHLAAMINAFTAGEPVKNRIDLDAGY